MLYVVFITEIALALLIVLMGYSIIYLIVIFVIERLQQLYKNWQEKKRHKRCEQQHEELLKLVRRKELRKREREKYPLFYLKEGIV